MTQNKSQESEKTLEARLVREIQNRGGQKMKILLFIAWALTSFLQWFVMNTAKPLVLLSNALVKLEYVIVKKMEELDND